jgi:dihydroorotate dehydrogenase (fumarate)
MKLRTPLVPSASPLWDDIDNIRRVEDAGASAIVLRSLFEEQLTLESWELHENLTQGTESYPEALTYFPQPSQFSLGPQAYVEHIRKAKRAVDIPIVASLNGKSLGGWTEFAQRIEHAGADALELNIYAIPTDPRVTAQQIEQTYLDIFKAVKSSVSIPVAVKLSPFFTSLANMANRLDAAGADAFVLFNRFYQPEIDVDTLEIQPRVLLSTPQAMRLPLTWIGILYDQVEADLAASSGIHTVQDALKMLMVGASVTMMCSALLRHGIEHIRDIERDMVAWMEEHEYESVEQMRGSMSQHNSPDPSAFERAQYMRAISRYVPVS